jgi:hypothetical protein
MDIKIENKTQKEKLLDLYEKLGEDMNIGNELSTNST